MKRFLIFLLAAMLPTVAAQGHDDGHAHEGGVEGPEMYNNDTWSHTFDAPGTFEYHCHPHPWMQATITVVESTGRAPMNHTVDIIEPENFEEWTFTPVDLTVEVGDTVTWLNGGAQMHKVAETTGEHADHIAGAGSGPADDHGDGHDHTHDDDSGFPTAFLWIGGAVIGGVIIAGQFNKRKSNISAEAMSPEAPVGTEEE